MRLRMKEDSRLVRAARVARPLGLALFACAMTIWAGSVAVAVAQERPPNTMEESKPDTNLEAARTDASVPDPDPLPVAFRPAVSAVERKGLAVEAYSEHRSDAGRYLAVIYGYPETAGEKAGTKSLKLYFQRAGSSVVSSSDLIEEAILGFGTYEDAGTVFADINKDGILEFVVSAANGGNCWACSNVRIYALGGPTPRLMVAEPMVLRDLDGDGSLELLVGDTRWESYDDFSHAAAPGGTMVYQWRDGKYIFAGGEAKAFYEKELDRYRGELAEAISVINAADPMSDERYLGLALSMYIARCYTDERERGEEELRRMLVDNAPSGEMRVKRARIMDDFLTGESARLLREPRRGDLVPNPMARPR
ncbi:MAG: hypothetical protein WBQ66_07770 [Blastocatellia bacterium]